MSGPTGIVAIRPEPGLSYTIALAREMGLTVIGAPLFEIRPRAWRCPDPDRIDALLVGSANAFLHGGAELARVRGKPVHAVGEATADAARQAHFRVAAVGTGGLQAVLDDIAPPARLLRLAGARHVPLTVPEGIAIDTAIAYESVALPFPRTLIADAGERPILLLHSAAAAEHFAGECDRLNLTRSAIVLAALGPRIAAAAGQGWREVHVAPVPADRALLEMVREACI